MYVLYRHHLCLSLAFICLYSPELYRDEDRNPVKRKVHLKWDDFFIGMAFIASQMGHVVRALINIQYRNLLK